MKNLKIATIGCHGNYLKEDLIATILQKKYNFKFISDPQNADIILQGVFLNHNNIFKKKINRYIDFFVDRFSDLNTNKSIKNIIDPNLNKIWIHISGESPNNNNKSSFLNSECDFGIGHETILHPNYIRMPFWYQSLDWSNFGFHRTDDAFYRLGSPIQINELMKGISSYEIKKKKLKCAIFASHLTSPRDIFVNEIQKFIDVDIFGINGSGPVQFRNCKPKRDILNNYVFTLCPENNLYPGYITEKIPESFACGSFPLTWYMDSYETDFTPGSHLNFASYGAKSISCDGFLVNLIENKYHQILNEGIEPLLNTPPTLDPIFDILDKVIAHCK